MLELQNISFHVPDQKKEILHEVTMTIGDNSFFVITGPNGGGKSTLAKIIMGIEKPSSGNLIFNGVDITNMDITQRAQAGIGFAFQQPVKFKGIYVHDLLKLASGRTLSTKDACQYLSEVGLCAADYINRELNASFSGGEMKRIEIAILMARKAKLSIFDEPEAGIDLWSFHNLIRIFENLRDATNGSVLIISHQERILDIADTIAVISEGQVTSIGNKAELLPGLLSDSSTCCEFYNRKGS